MNMTSGKLSAEFSLQLESLRGVSAIVVLFSHCFQAFIAPFDVTLYSWIRLFGQAAVMMFFALSGYLIGTSIQQNIQNNGQFDLRHYVRQRCHRILPPFLFALVLTVLLYLLAPFLFSSQSHQFEHNFGMMIRTDYSLEWENLLSSLLFLNGFVTPTLSANAPLWSLSYEVWFYVLAGFLPFLRNSVLAQASFILVLVILSLLNPQFLIYFLLWLSAFSSSFQQVQQYLLNHLSSLKLVFFSLALLIACIDNYVFHFIEHTNIYRGSYFVPFNLCIGLGWICWLIQLQYQHSYYHPVWIQSAGFSYTLYVTHFPLLLFILGCFPQSRSYGLGGAVLALLASMTFLIFFAWFIARWLEPQKRKALLPAPQ
ncbi:acyltransferase [Acinetobacter thermotolerans]|uniref:acyltransferase family protein n=1 Tax=Acinetobacter thermotolerans TaxID=3151487 RepID=UPI00325AB25A